MSDKTSVTITVNGEVLTALAEPRLSLADFLREEGLTGTHVGCEHGVCGACTVMVDGATARGCLILAVQCDGREVETIEGATKSERLKDLQDNFVECNSSNVDFARQAWFSPQMNCCVKTHHQPAQKFASICPETIVAARGYQAIVDAVELTAKQRRGEA